MKKITSMILALVFAVSLIGSASAKTLKIQLTFPKTSYDGQIVKMWTDRVTKLTRGELKFELLSKGEVVGMKETLEAVDKVLLTVVLLGLTTGLTITQLQCYLVRQLQVVVLV